MGVKERERGCWLESSRRGSKKDTGKYVAVSGQLCRRDVNCRSADKFFPLRTVTLYPL